MFTHTSWTAPEVPKWFRKGLVAIGGLNGHGEPNLRVVDASREREFRNGNPQAIKYINPNNSDKGWFCFVLERYAEPDFFNEEQWEAVRWGADTLETGKRIDYLGPFPRRGRYILVAPLVDEEGAPLPLSSAVLDELQARVVWGSADKALGALETRRQRQSAEAAAKMEEELANMHDYFNTVGPGLDTLATRHEYSYPTLEFQSAAQIREAAKTLLSKPKTTGGANHVNGS